MPRLIARELMDDDTTSGEAVWRGSLRDLARVNSLLGGRHLQRCEIDRLDPLPRRILDVATGQWEDGRVATVRGIRQPNRGDYGCIACAGGVRNVKPSR